KLKYQPVQVALIENKVIGSMKADDQKDIALLKVKLANTSDETLTLDTTTATLFDPDSLSVFDYEVKQEDFDALGDLALPTSIPANTVVEGYIPFYKSDMNLTHVVW